MGRKKGSEWKHSKGRASPSIQILGPRPLKKRRKKLSKHEFLKERASKMRRRPTGAESVFAQKLDNLKIVYEQQWVVKYVGIDAIYDFYLPKMRLLVEVDGGYHGTDEQQQTDRIKDFIATKKLKRQILRISNEDAICLSDADIKTLIEDAQNSMAKSRMTTRKRDIPEPQDQVGGYSVQYSA